MKINTLNDLIDEVIAVYGKQKWTYSTFRNNSGIYNNYIKPTIGNENLKSITRLKIDRYYQSLLSTPAVRATANKPLVTPSVIREINKLLKLSFAQGIRWGIVKSNPCVGTILPDEETNKRVIWTAEQFFVADKRNDNQLLKLAMNLAFGCTCRIGEILGLTWDSVYLDNTKNNRICICKELQRINKSILSELNGKGVVTVFPSLETSTTTLCLKEPKTKSSVRTVYIPDYVSELLVERRSRVAEEKEALGELYTDYNLVFATGRGWPIEEARIDKAFKNLADECGLPRVSFHSLRHSSITYKLKLSQGDIKAVQGDSGHSQTSMITEVYSHILDEDRKKNAINFQENIYNKYVADMPSANVQTSKIDNDYKKIDPNEVLSLIKILLERL